MRILNFITINLLILNLFSCQTIENRGQFIENEKIESLKTSHKTKAEVVEYIGSPTLTPVYNSNNWYYVYRSLLKQAWFEPKIIEQKIVEIKFNDKNIINTVELRENIQQEIPIKSDFTETHGTESTKIQKFIRNIGRYNGSKEVKKKKK